MQVRKLWIRAVVFDKVKDALAPITAVELVTFQRDQSSESAMEYTVQHFEKTYRKSIIILRFVHKAQLFTDPRLTAKDEIRSGKLFEAFWRTLVYNRAGTDPRDEQPPRIWFVLSFMCWYMMAKLFLTRGWEKDFDSFKAHYEILNKVSFPFARAFERMYATRLLFISESGRMEWAPPDTCPGDSIAAFWGNRIPFVAQCVDGDVWEYGGGCYVHGCMDGELSTTINKSEWDFMRFV